jgi:hypothetical protein
MSKTLLLMSALAPIGAIDVLYYHLYRYRLYRRAESAAEEVTHLLRHVCFLAIFALLARGTPTSSEDRALIALFVVDFLNSALDVALEPRSRAPLGGLPRGEYVLHFLGTFGMGLAAATYMHERVQGYGAAPTWQVAPTLALGTALFLLEFVLFLRACVIRTPKATATGANSSVP